MGYDRAGNEVDPTGPLVLLVEDDETLQVTTRLVLQRHGFRVTTADDGIDGLEKLATVTPDVLLVDVVMPRMDGITFVRRARERCTVPAVVLTARDLPHDQLAGFEAGPTTTSSSRSTATCWRPAFGRCFDAAA